MTDPAPPRSPLTLRDVSEASGVSEMTVSRVLRGRGEVSAATRARVLEAAQRLGYVPNRIAGALASSRVNLVGVIIPSLSNMVFPEVFEGISEGLAGTPLQPVLGVTGYDTAREEAVIYEMLSWRPSGLIIAGLDHSAAARAMLRGARIPVVEILDDDGTPVDGLVGMSQRAAGAETARAIIAAGYGRIGYLGTAHARDTRARKRFEGFTAALARAGRAVAAQDFYSGGSALAKGREMTARLLARHPDLDCLYYANDVIAAGGLLHCLEAGLDIPGRIGLVGFNGIDLLEGLPMRLATIDSHRRETGRRAAELIVAGGSAGGAARRTVFVPRLDPGQTLRPGG